jgi:general secretion pathway protein C
MRLALDPRAQRLLRRVPRTNVYTLAELALLSLLAIQCARLVWVAVTPWVRSATGSRPRPSLLRSRGRGCSAASIRFSAWRTGGGAGGGDVAQPQAVRRPPGHRLRPGLGDHRASRRAAEELRGGDEIMPGVRLEAVAFDNVTISRGGAAEQLFMDQSKNAPAVAGAPAVPGAPAPPSQGLVITPAPPPLPVVTVPPPPPAPPPSSGNLSSQIGFAPRMNGSQVTGVVLSPQGSGEAFRAAGLQPGDVLLSVGGQRITSPAQLAALRGQIGTSNNVSVQVERGGRVTRLQLRNTP